MNSLNLNEIERRQRKYWNVDGLPELVMGALWVAWSGLSIVGTALPRGVASTCFWLVIPPALAGSGLFMGRALQKLKERITYPRAGYVRMKEQPSLWVLALVALIALTAAGAIVFGFLRDTEEVLPPLVVAVLTMWLLTMALHARALHLLLLSLVSASLGVWLWRSAAGWAGLNWTFLWLGLASLLVGVVRLRRFLRNNPKPEETNS